MSEEILSEIEQLPTVPNYNADQIDVSHLTRLLLSDKAVERLPDGSRFATIEVEPGSKFANIGRYIESRVFMQTFGNTPETLQESYAPYEDSSRFFLSVDVESANPTGVLRVIANSPAGLMTINDVEDQPFGISREAIAKVHGVTDFDKTWDVGTVAVLPEYRRGQGPVSIQLFRAMYLSAVNHSVEHLVSMIDDKLYKKLHGALGIPFKPLAGAKPGPYMDSEKTHPVYGFVPDFYNEMSAHRKSIKGRMLAKYAIGDSLDRLVEGSQDDLIILA